MSRRTIAKGAAKKQQIRRNRKPVNSPAKCIRICGKLEAYLDGIYRSFSSLDSNFAGISRNFAGIFFHAQRLFYEIPISEAI